MRETVPELIRKLEALGYRVIPEANIRRVAAGIAVPTHCIATDPDGVRLHVNRTLSHVIRGELEGLILKNTEHHSLPEVFDVTRFTTSIEVIT